MKVCDVIHEGNLIYCEDLSWKPYVFIDRLDGGYQLAKLIEELGIIDDKTIVYGLVAGGVPVASIVSNYLHLPMDIIVVKKITFPWTTEAGFGAVTVDGEYVYDKYLAHEYLGYTSEDVARRASMVHEYVVKRCMKLRGTIEYRGAHGCKAILVDDGIATGYTVVAGIEFLRRLGLREVYVATPTSSSDGAELVSQVADKVIVLNIKHPPYAVADAYIEWHDVSDEEVLEILDILRKRVLYPAPSCTL